MRILPSLITLLYLSGVQSARADVFQVLVGYTCDRKTNELTLRYDGVSGEKAIAHLEKGRRKTQWNPWQLTKVNDEDYIASLISVKRKCQLSDGVYDITLQPVPGNLNVQGQCGAWISAQADVTKAGSPVYSVAQFANDCRDWDSPIITRVVIRPGTRSPQVTTVAPTEFYK